MITLIIIIGVLWIFLKLLTFTIELPFRFVGALLKAPISVLFWMVIFALFLSVIL